MPGVSGRASAPLDHREYRGKPGAAGDADDLALRRDAQVGPAVGPFQAHRIALGEFVEEIAGGVAARLLLDDEGQRLGLRVRHRVGAALAARHLQQHVLTGQERDRLLRPAAERNHARHQPFQRLHRRREQCRRRFLPRALHLAEAHLDRAVARGQRLAAEDAVALAPVALAQPGRVGPEVLHRALQEPPLARAAAPARALVGHGEARREPRPQDGLAGATGEAVAGWLQPDRRGLGHGIRPSARRAPAPAGAPGTRRASPP